MDCLTITIHAGKCYKVFIDLGAAISLIRDSTYQSIDSSLKTHIQATTTKLNMADGSPMMALGMAALHLPIAEVLYATDYWTQKYCLELISRKNSLWHAWDEERNCYLKKDSRFLTYIRNCEQNATIGIFKSTLKIPPRHNDIIPIKIKGHAIKGHTAYFISDEDSIKGKDPNINIINSMNNIKGKTSVNILVLNYTNKHITFNKGEYMGHLEATMEEIPQTTESPDVPTTHSITTEKMTSEKVELDTIKPPCHKLKQHIETTFASLLKGYNSQFAQDETFTGTTPLTEISTSNNRYMKL